MKSMRPWLVLPGFALAALGILHRSSPAVLAADVTSTWSTASSGNWNVNGNWTNVPVLGGFPNNGNGGATTYDAVIGPAGSPYTVTLNTNVTVEDLLLNSANATLSHTSGTLTATGAITLSVGAFSLAGGTIANSTVNATVPISFTNAANTLSGVTVNGDLSFPIDFARVVIAGGTTFSIAHLSGLRSEISFAPAQTLSGTIQFEGGGGNLRHVSMSTPGSLTIGASGVIKTAAGLTGDATVGVGFNYTAAMALTNNGLISSQVSGRTLTINPATSFTNGGTGNVQATGGGIVTLNSTYTNAGTFTINAGTLNLGGTFNATGGIGTWSNTGGTVNVTGTITNTGNTLTLNNSTGSWTLNGGTINGGTLALTDGKTLSFTNAANTLSGVTVNGDLSFPDTFARVVIAGGATFSTAHLSGLRSEISFAPAQTLSGTIQFEGGGGNLRHVSMSTPGSLTVGASGVIKTAAGLTGDATIGVGFNYTAAMALTNNGLISSEVSGRTLTINSATSFTNGGTGNVQATGGGIVTLNSTYTNAGTFTINAGTLNLGGTFNATGGIGTWSNTGGTVNVTGTITNTGNTLTLNNSTGSWTLNGGTINGGTLALTDGKTLSFTNAANTLSGVTVNGDLSFPDTFARVVIAGGATFSTAHLSGLRSEISFAPAQTLSGTIQFEGGGGNLRHVSMSMPGSLTIGASGVIKTAAGLTGDATIGVGFNYTAAMALTNNGLISSQVSGRTITINPATSFTNGATGTLEAMSGGILTVAPTGTWTNAGMINVNAATVNLGGTFDATGGIGTWSNTGGIVNVTGTINAGSGANTLTLNNSTGSWTLNGGTINGGTLAFADGKTLSFTNAANTLSGVTVNGDLSFPVDFARVVIAGGTTFSTAHLSGLRSEISFAPAQTLSGTIQFEGGGGNLRHVSMSMPGSLTIGASGVLKTAAGLTGDATIGVGFNYTAAMALTNNGLISSEVSGRTLTINPATSFTNGGTLEAVNGGTLVVPLGYTQIAGITRISSGGTISVLNGATTNTISVMGGRLEGSGTITAKVANSGTIAPGLSAGTLAITGDVTLASTSTLQIEIGGTTPGTQYDRLHVTGQMTLGGTLDVSLINGFNLAAGNLFDVLDWGSVNGKFSSILLPPLSGSLSWYTSQLYNNGRVLVIDINFLPGDFSRDSHINAADIPAMLAALADLNFYKSTNSLNSAQLLSIGDIDLSGTLTNTDVQALIGLLRNGGGLMAAVPEPATIVLLALALPALALIVRRKRATQRHCIVNLFWQSAMLRGALILFSTNRATMLRASLALAAALAISAPAAGQTWNGAAGNGNWSTAANWSTGAVPNSPTASTTFNSTGPSPVNISASVQTQSLFFGNGPSFTITSSSGQTLSGVTSIAVGVFTGTTQTVNLATIASGSLLFPIGSNLTLANDAGATGVASPTLVIGPNTVIGTRGTNGVIVQGTGTTLISGSFADGSAPNNRVIGGLTKSGPGTLMLTGNNANLSGLMSVTGGTLAINANAALGNAANTLSFSSVGGSLLFLNGGVDVSRSVALGGAGRFISNDADANTISGFISGTDGPLYKDGAGTLTLSNVANNYTTQTQVMNGVLAIPTIANAGAPSPIGSSVAPIFLGTGTTRGTLLLTGTNASYLSNRNLQLGGGLNPYPVGGAIGVQNLGTTLTMSGQLSNGALIKTGAGTLSLTYPTNVYTAGTYVEAGTLNIGIAGAAIPLDSNVTVFTGATLRVGIPESQTIINGGRIGTLTLDGGTLRVPNRTIDYTLNNLEMTAGRLDFTGSSSFLLKFLALNGPRITTNASSMPAIWVGDPGTGIRNDATSYALTIRVNAGTTAAGIDLDAGIPLISNQSDVDFVLKVGTGTMRLTHLANTSKFLVQQGALRVDDVTTNGVGALGSGLLVLDGGRLAYGGATATLTKPFTVGSSHGGTLDVLTAATTLTVTSPIDFGNGFAGHYGGLTKAGPGVLVLNNPSNQYPGGITISGGRLNVGDDAQLGVANPTVNPAGTLRYTASLSTARTFNLAGGTLEAPAGVTLTLNGAAVNGGFLRGAGTFAVTGGTAISGASTATSTTISQTGSASVANFSNGGAFTVAGGQILAWNGGTNTASGRLTVDGNANASSLVSYGQITIPDGTLNNSDASLVLGGGSRTFVGTPEIPGGSINLLSGTTIELNGALLVNNGTVNGTVNVNFGSAAKGSGVYGVVNVNQGGVYAPGNSPGISTAAAVMFNNTPTTSGAPILMMELGGITPGTGHDQLKVTGQLSLGGILQTVLVPGFTPQLGDSFDILNWGTLSGTFATLDLPSLNGGLGWNTSQLYTTGTLSVATMLLLGDFNRDSHVNAADIPSMLAALTDLNNYKSINSLTDANLLAIGDINSSGALNNADVQALLNLLKSGGGSVTPVPEPASLILLALALPALLISNRRKRKCRTLSHV